MLEGKFEDIPVIQLLGNLVEVPSESKNEEAVAELLDDYLSSSGLQVGHHKFNVHATIGSTHPDAQTLLFVSHIDTVAVTPSWSIDPHKPTITGRRMYGLGSNDAKASVSAMFHALLEINNSPLSEELVKSNQAITVVAAAEEEIAGWDGFRGLAPLIPNIKTAIIGEPSSLRIGNSQKGREVIDLTTKGQSAHSSRPHEGVNAAKKLIDELAYILTWYDKVLKGQPGAPTLEITILKAGEKTNQLPHQAIATFDSRTTPAFTGEFVLSALSGNKFYSDTEIVGREQNSVPAKFTIESSPLIAAVKSALIACSIDPVIYDFPAASDWAFMPAGVDGIVLGPGDSNQSHQADESVDLLQVIMAQNVYAAIMKSSLNWLKGIKERFTYED